jgi:hypothetical protein
MRLKFKKGRGRKNIMVVKLLAHSKPGFYDKEDLRRYINNLGDGIYPLKRVYTIPSNTIVLFEMEGHIIGCAVVEEAVRVTNEKERANYDGWKGIMKLDPSTIWVWRPEQDVKLKDAGIIWEGPGHPMDLNEKQLLKTFKLVAERSK